MRILLARQPVLNTANQIVGYEIFCADGDQHASSDEVLVDALLGTSLDDLRQGLPAYLAVSAGLLRRTGSLLLPERVVLQVQVDDDEEGVPTCRELTKAGFSLVLDHYTGEPRQLPYLDVVDTVKLDVRAFHAEALQEQAGELHARGLQLMADKVEHFVEYEYCRRLGFTLFQGCHFSRPELVERKDVAVQHLRIFRVMRMVNNLAITDHAVEQEFQADAALCYKLLRIANSATIAGVGVRSVGHAIRLLGREQLYRWLALLLVGRSQDPALEREIMRAALLRARFCELLVEDHLPLKVSPGSAFMVGLLSALEPHLGLSPEAVARELELAAEPARALCAHAGPLGDLLSLAEAYETGRFNDVLSMAERARLKPAALVSAYLDAVGFVTAQVPEPIS